ncbi:MAG: DNA polymerase I [Chitinophagales bacterium]|nr:DNA polymerase I [Chitinophagales bacterium]
MKEVPIDKKLFLLDAYALIYRAYFALNSNAKGTTGFHNSKGFNTSTVYGFTNTLLDLLTKEKPTHIAVVFDAPGITDRAVEHDFYKANRQEMPEDIRSSIPIIKDLIKAFRIPILEVPGYEADDVICTVAKQAEKDGYQVYMVTPDKDFGQAVTDNIFIMKPAYKGGGFEIMDRAAVLKKWEIARVEQVIDILGMMGDAVDNIPGIAGVGEKTASKLLAQFGSMENMYENLDQIQGKLKDKIAEGKEMAFISKKLATILCDAPVEVNEEELVISEPDRDALAALFSELEFRTIGKRVLGETFSVNISTEVKKETIDLFSQPVERETTTVTTVTEVIRPLEAGKNIQNTPHHYELVDTPEKRKALIALLSKQSSFCFDSETTSINAHDCELVGLAFSVKAGEGYYVPVPCEKEEATAILEEFRSLFENESILKIGQNVKYDIMALYWHKIGVKGPLFDTMLAHYLIDPESRHNMDALAENYLGYTPVSIETLIGKKGKEQGTMRDVELEAIKEYAAEDADVTLQLKEKFAPLIKENGFEKLFYEIENPLVYVLADMECEGVRVDKDFLSNYSQELATDIARLKDEIFTCAGTNFNIESPKQLGDVLFSLMKIPYVGKKTKTGQYSTNEEVLSKLCNEHEIAQKLLDYRELVKLKSTYVDALPQLINQRTGRIHSSFNQAVAATGRLSSQNPNLQNIPIRTEKGRRIRKAFVPRDEEHVILSADYSQIELRLVAAISGDKAMKDAFQQGLDIHTATAAKVYGVPLDQVTGEMRRNAKAVNFGIIYGSSAFGLSQNLGIPRREAADLIENYFKEYSGIKAYMQQAVAEAKLKGFAQTLMGRRRYLPDIRSGNMAVRGSAERNAINAPIQGTAADMIKIAMVNIHQAFKAKGFKSKLTLQVHDELVFDVHHTEVEAVKPLVEELMKNALPVDVPILVETGTGNNWLEAH